MKMIILTALSICSNLAVARSLNLSCTFIQNLENGTMNSLATYSMDLRQYPKAIVCENLADCLDIVGKTNGEYRLWNSGSFIAAIATEDVVLETPVTPKAQEIGLKAVFSYRESVTSYENEQGVKLVRPYGVFDYKLYNIEDNKLLTYGATRIYDTEQDNYDFNFFTSAVNDKGILTGESISCKTY